MRPEPFMLRPFPEEPQIPDPNHGAADTVKEPLSDETTQRSSQLNSEPPLNDCITTVNQDFAKNDASAHRTPTSVLCVQMLSCSGGQGQG